MLYSAEIGRNIVLLRKARNITQEQLALISNISVTYCACTVGRYTRQILSI